MNSNRKVGILTACLMTVVAMVACTDSAKAKISMVFKDAPKPGLVAKINGEEITEEQLVGDAQLELMQVKKQEFDLKMSQLNKMITERVLGAEAMQSLVYVDDLTDPAIP